MTLQLNYLTNGDRLHDARDIARLRELTERIKREAPMIDRLMVVGHTDPLGNEALNIALSQRRAKNIAAEISASTGIAQSIESIGSGPQNLIEPGCHLRGLSRAQETVCNAPNRRVNVLIYQK